MSHFCKRIFRGSHFLINTGLALFLLVIATLIASKLDYTFTFSARSHKISPRAESMLKNLTGDLHCTVILPANNIFYNNVRQLLLNMDAATPHARLELEFLDPHIDLSRASDAVRRYNADGWSIIFEKDGRIEKIPFDDLIETAEKEKDSMLHGAVVNYRFRGEQLFVTAITRLARPHSPSIYALTGHGERDFSNYDKLSGYSDLAREIHREGYKLTELSLTQTDVIPEDCNLLFIAGPKNALREGEMAKINSYLANGGRIMLLIDRSARIPNGWEELVNRLGMKFANLTAISEGTLGGYNLSIDNFSDHPIARDLTKNTVIFSSPQVIDTDENLALKYRLSTTVIAAAGDKAWGETTPDILPRRYDPAIDRKGLLPIAVATELIGSDDLGIAVMKGFVVGDSNLGSNAFLGGGNTANRDILLNAIAWLTDSGMPSASSLAAEGNALQLNFSIKRQLRFCRNTVIFWPLGVCFVGVIVFWLKKIFS